MKLTNVLSLYEIILLRTSQKRWSWQKLMSRNQRCQAANRKTCTCWTSIWVARWSQRSTWAVRSEQIWSSMQGGWEWGYIKFNKLYLYIIRILILIYYHGDVYLWHVYSYDTLHIITVYSHMLILHSTKLNPFRPDFAYLRSLGLGVCDLAMPVLAISYRTQPPASSARHSSRRSWFQVPNQE